jgi:TP901 family phage tail tape measure protein
MARGNNVLQIVINGTNRAGPAFAQVGAQAARMGGLVVSSLTAATYRAGKFEKGLAEISTLLDGDTTPAIKRMRTELLELSIASGQAIGKMTKARYDVISAGFTDAADSALVLGSASKLAVAGVSDVAVSADLLTSALGGLQLQADQSERVINVLFQTVRKGKTTLDQLGQGMGKLFGTAKLANISIELLGASMATATAAGVQTAEAVTGLNALILALAAPTQEAKDALEDAGISMEGGFLRALIAVNKAAGDSPKKLRELIPSVEALRVASVIAGNIGLMTENLYQMDTATGVVDEGVKKMAQTFDFRLNQAKRAVDALTIQVGSVFLPEATKMVTALTKIVKAAVDNEDKIRAITRTIGKWAAGVTAAGVAISALSATMTILGPVITALGVGFMTASIPIQLTIVGIIGLIVAYARYRDAMWETIPILRTVGNVAGFVKDRIQEMSDALDDVSFNKRVTEKMKELLELQDTPGKGGLFQMGDDLAAVREYAEIVVRAEDALMGTGKKNIIDEASDSAVKAVEEIEGLINDLPQLVSEAAASGKEALADLYAQANAMINNLARASVKAQDIVFMPSPEAMKEKLGPALPADFMPLDWTYLLTPDVTAEEALGPFFSEAERVVQEHTENLRVQMADLAQFAVEDFMDMAFSIGQSFAQVTTQVAAHLLGLTKGPLMLGRAFKQMAISILADLASIIARMLVARALLAAFGGGGIFGGAFRALGFLPSAHGRTVAHAASGYTVPSAGGGYFPPIILPGSPGLDRTPVLARGGERLISPETVRASETMLRKVQTAPRRARDSGTRRGATMKLELQANRPFRREEQINLSSSVEEGLSRSSRHRS